MHSNDSLCLYTGISTAAVCVYPSRVADCVKALKKARAMHIPIASGKVWFFYEKKENAQQSWSAQDLKQNWL